ncbi:hypothetical protein BGZ96_004122 [Linnemannia gamsii]|uniref:Beta-lactamase-related domain-containing protein n=1 Tax=Linnemannia gamsii TaxID=64522 RepID=A0ABQ7K7C2_9FUNG|nr:hypothetical protein BGZ96_004122 [Linnemannia gamsii]
MTSAEPATTTTAPATKDFQAKSKPLQDLGTMLEKYRVEGGIPGMAVSVLYKGELIFAEGFGNPIGELVAEGKMDWDTTPVNTYLPEFELKDPVHTSTLTMVDLLSHRTLVRSIRTFPMRNCDGPSKTKESRIELIKSLKYADQPSKLTPECNFSNTMYAVAGEAGARVAGVSWEELVKSKIIDPLNLINTGFSQLALKNFSYYALPYDAASFEDAKKGNYISGELFEDYLKDAPASDMYSNVLDLAR